MNIRVLAVAAMLVAVVAALSTMGAQAFFGDSERIDNNLVVASIADAEIIVLTDAGPSAGTALLSLSGMQPGDKDTVELTVVQAGAFEGHLDLTFIITGVRTGRMTDLECTSQALGFDPVDETCTNPGPVTDPINDIDGFLLVSVDEDVPPATLLVAQGSMQDLNGFCIELGTFAVGASKDLLLNFELDAAATNEYHGDIVDFDVQFGLHQINNPTPHASVPGEQCGGGPLP